MKKILFILLLFCSTAYADTAILQSSDGTAISASNPLQVTYSGGNAGGWTDNGTSVYTTTSTDNVGIGTFSSNALLNVSSAAAQDLVLVEDSGTGDTTPAFKIDQNGNVGIGTTSTSVRLLEISSSNPLRIVRPGLNAFNYSISGTNPNSSGGDLVVGTGQADGGFFFKTTSGTLNSFMIKEDGNIGIGTFDSFSKLAVSGGVVVGSGTTYISAIAPTDGVAIQGNVGIGSLAPGTALDVVGGVRVSTGTAGQAACYKSDKTLGQCTTVVGAGGGCTCS